MAQKEQSGGGKDGAGLKVDAGGKPQAYDAFGRYSGPTGGAAKTRDGSVRVFAAEDEDGTTVDAPRNSKLAGADSEAGKTEPRSLLSATREQLEHIADGTGQAVIQGAAGARQALARTADELAHNEELHKGVEFGVKAAGEVSKDVWKTVGTDVAFNIWDTAGADGAKALGLNRTAAILNNSAVTAPLNKIISASRLGQSVFNGEAEQESRDLGRRIHAIQQNIYREQK
jgi:hypothetical protein